MKLYLGIDLGTSGCRAAVVDQRGRPREICSVPLPAPVTAGAGREQDPALWWEAVREATAGLLARVDPARIAAVAIDGTSGTLLLAGRDGEPLGPALMYDDARSAAEARAIAAAAPPDCAAHGPTSSLAKLLHLQGRPEAFAACYALHQADWVAARLTGRVGMSDENNCLKLGYDCAARAWPDWLAALGVRRELLPRVVVPGTPIGRVTAAAARATGLPAGTPVVAGTTDGVAAFLATGAGRAGDAVTSLGSTLVLKLCSRDPVFAPRYGVYSHRLGDRWLVGGASNSGGAVLRRYFTPGQMEAMSARLSPERPTGLDYYPLPGTGERFPIEDPGLTARLAPRPADDLLFFQGMLEGIAHIEAQGYRLLAELGAPCPRRVLTVGGGAANAAWTAIRARMLGVPVSKARCTEPAFGAARLAARAHAAPGDEPC